MAAGGPCTVWWHLHTLAGLQICLCARSPARAGTPQRRLHASLCSPRSQATPTPLGSTGCSIGGLSERVAARCVTCWRHPGKRRRARGGLAGPRLRRGRACGACTCMCSWWGGAAGRRRAWWPRIGRARALLAQSGMRGAGGARAGSVAGSRVPEESASAQGSSIPWRRRLFCVVPWVACTLDPPPGPWHPTHHHAHHPPMPHP